MSMYVQQETTAVIHISLTDDVVAAMAHADRVQIVLHSRARNRLPAPITLPYTTIDRLTKDM